MPIVTSYGGYNVGEMLGRNSHLLTRRLPELAVE